MQDLDAVLELLQEHLEDAGTDPEGKEKAAQLIPVLEAYRDRGLQDGPLGVWWAEWPQVQSIVDQLIGTEEEVPGEAGVNVDLESLKSLLLQRLEEGAADEAILAELWEQVPANVLDQWRGRLRFAPVAFVTDMLNIPEKHMERIKILIKAIQGNFDKHNGYFPIFLLIQCMLSAE